MSVIHVLVQLDRLSPGDPTDTGWYADVCSPKGLEGLFAMGADFAEARRNVAIMVWEAIRGGTWAEIDPDEIDSIHILAITHKRFATKTLGVA